jgi:hypothetical protein
MPKALREPGATAPKPVGRDQCRAQAITSNVFLIVDFSGRAQIEQHLCGA